MLRLSKNKIVEHETKPKHTHTTWGVEHSGVKHKLSTLTNYPIDGFLGHRTTVGTNTNPNPDTHRRWGRTQTRHPNELLDGWILRALNNTRDERKPKPRRTHRNWKVEHKLGTLTNYSMDCETHTETGESNTN